MEREVQADLRAEATTHHPDDRGHSIDLHGDCGAAEGEEQTSAPTDKHWMDEA